MNFQVANKNEDLLIKNHVSNNSSELSEIFNEDVNISIWKRHLDSQIINASNYIINENPDLQFSELVKYDDVDKILVNNLGQNENTLYLIKDISRVVKLFCDLSTNKKPVPRKIRPIKLIAIILAPRDSIFKILSIIQYTDNQHHRVFQLI